MTGEALLSFVNEKLFPTLKNLPIDANTPRAKSIVQETFADLNQYMKNGTLLRQVVNIVNEIEFDDADDRHTFGDIYEGILKDLQSAGNAGEFYTPRALTDFIVMMLDRNWAKPLATSPVEREASSPRHLNIWAGILALRQMEKTAKCRCRSGMETVALPFEHHKPAAP